MGILTYKPLPLTEIAFRRVVACLFTESTILLSISNFQSKYSPYDPEDYTYKGEGYDEQLNSLHVWDETLQVKLSHVIPELNLPKPLLPRLNEVFVQMGRQVKKWKEFHEEYLLVPHRGARYFEAPVLQKLRWTAAGGVDYRKTAEELVRSDVLAILIKFRLACLYCLEDYIPDFWGEIPKEKQRYFRESLKEHYHYGGLCQEYWWRCFIQGRESEKKDSNRSTFRHRAFECAVLKGNKTAAEYYLQKLTDKENAVIAATETFKKSNFSPDARSRVFPMKKCFEMLVYFLSVTTPDEQVRTTREKPLVVLECFLAWPLQDMFSVIADNMWKILSDEDRDLVLFFMYKNSEKFGENSLNLFRDFFPHIGSEFWTGFVDRQSVSGSDFNVTLVDGGVKPLELCFGNLDATARKRLVLSEASINVFKEFIQRGKPDVVEFCLRDVSLSREEKKALNESLQIEMMPKTRKWSGLVNLLGELNDDNEIPE